jgi:hypothetical protein
MVAAAADGGSTVDDFQSALERARGRAALEHDPTDTVDIAMPYDDLRGEAGSLAWAMAPTNTVLLEAIRSDRLSDEGGAAPKTPRAPRAFLFGRDGSDGGAPAFVVRGSFVNRYDDERTAVETPAPWDTPDGMTPANEVVKGLPWGEGEAGGGRGGAHYSFEESVRVRGVDAEDAWVLDSGYVEDLRERAAEAGYGWVEGDSGPSPDEQTLGELAGWLEGAEVDRERWGLVGGDGVVVRYESKQTGGLKEKRGTVTAAGGSGFAFERGDGETNRVKADGGEVGIYSTSRYPFMGLVRSVEVAPEGAD